jgi:hypothetical protein
MRARIVIVSRDRDCQNGLNVERLDVKNSTHGGSIIVLEGCPDFLD